MSGVEIDIDMGQGPPVMIPGNRNNLESVFHNLLSNSLDAFKTCKNSPKKISVSLCQDSAPSSVCIRYSDNAGGMTKEVVERIFDAFFTTKAVGSGTGLGMAIVHQIILGHKGRISVESTLGEGSVFTIKLPAGTRGVKDEVPELSSANLSKESLKTAQKKPVILVVDDEVEICHLLIECIGDEYELVTCNDPIKAIDLVKSRPFDLLLTDFKMPRMSGEDLAQEIRKIDPFLPIVFMTGDATSNFTEIKEKFEYSHLIFKPFYDFKIVAKEIRFGISLRPAHKDKSVA